MAQKNKISTIEISACPKLETLHLPHEKWLTNKTKAFFSNIDKVKISYTDKRGNTRTLRTIKGNESVEMKFNGSRWVETKVKYFKRNKK